MIAFCGLGLAGVAVWEMVLAGFVDWIAAFVC